MTAIGEKDARAMVQIRPAIRFEGFLETVHSLTRDGESAEQGTLHPLQMAVLLHAFKDEIQLPAAWQRVMFSVISAPLVPIGKRLGYRATYSEFSGANA